MRAQRAMALRIVAAIYALPARGAGDTRAMPRTQYARSASMLRAARCAAHALRFYIF